MVKQCLCYILQKICNFIIFKIFTFKPKNSYSTLSNNLASTAPQSSSLADERRIKYNFKNRKIHLLYIHPLDLSLILTRHTTLLGEEE